MRTESGSSDYSDEDDYEDHRSSRRKREFEEMLDQPLETTERFYPEKKYGSEERGDAYDKDRDVKFEVSPGLEESGKWLGKVDKLIEREVRKSGAEAESYRAAMKRAKAIIGRDDRQQVKDTSKPPFSWICSLQIDFGSGNQMIGTGWLITPTTLITAGHCVHNFKRADGRVGPATRIRVMPARNGSRSDIGSPWIEAEWWVTTKLWIESRGDSQPADYGAIRLPSPVQWPRGSGSGFGFGVFRDEEMRGKKINVVGYPGKPGNGSTMWGHADLVQDVDAHQIHYLSDTSGGESGGPAYFFDSTSQKYWVAGIHNYGAPDVRNTATRITDSVFDLLQRWKKAP